MTASFRGSDQQVSCSTSGPYPSASQRVPTIQVSDPPVTAVIASPSSPTAGNVIGFGATAGEILLRGVVGERFCVRNSGAVAVVEGVGDHGCEYMTGGRVVVLGDTGRNFAAGMSGGIAYVYDPFGKLPANLNTELVDPDEVDSDDLEFLHGIIDKHGNETDSPVAAAILADWDNTKDKFIKVMPRDFKKVLAAIESAEKDGRNVDEAIMEAARG